MPTPDDTPLLFEGLGESDDSRGLRHHSKVGAASAEERVHRLAGKLGHRLYLGTSSWSFPGWAGIVYDRAVGESMLARDGLAAYARHPLFRTVGLDKTYYRPAPRDEYARLASQVPDDFRFLVKAWRALVEREAFDGGTSQAFLDAGIATREFVLPALDGLGSKTGPLLFQFPPMRFTGARDEAGFLATLDRFLAELPRGPLYAVEVRNRTLVGPVLGEMLAARGVVPCLTVHPTMPDVGMQSRELALDPTRPLVMRWMLRANHRYAEAKDLYAPFDRVVEPDDESRDALARLARAAIDAGLATWIIVNNKAEGSSPLSVERLARRIGE